MARIPNEIVNQILSEVNIVDLINSYIPLQKRGNNYLCACPFHEDNNPSFSVSETKQIFKCFSCGRAGNIYSFIQEYEHVGFVDAVIKAAEFANIKLPDTVTQSTKVNPKIEILYQIHQKVVEFYHYYLTQTHHGEKALDYLTQRGINAETIERFNIGYAPNNSELIYQILQNEDFTDEQLIQSGIFYQNDRKQMIDRFKNRLIIPLRDEQGRTIALSGRLIEDNPSLAKYINSPETDIFVKSRFLFNMDLARQAVRQSEELLITEGYMDVISLSQAGFLNSVATMGTAFTSDHLRQIKRITRHVKLVFDGDRAGQDAMSRAMDRLIDESSLSTEAVIIPEGRDPDDWIKRSGKAGFQTLLDKSKSYYDFKKAYLASSYNLSLDNEKAQYIEQLIKTVALIPSSIEQQLRVQEIVAEFQLNEAIVQEQLTRATRYHEKEIKQQSHSSKITKTDIPAESFVTSKITVESKKAYQAERTILFNLIYHEAAWKYIQQLDEIPIMYHDLSNRAFLALDRYYYEGNHFPMTQIVHQIDDGELNQWLQDIMWSDEVFDFNEQEMADCFGILKKEFIGQKIDELRTKLKQAKQENNQTTSQEIFQQIFLLMKEYK